MGASIREAKLLLPNEVLTGKSSWVRTLHTKQMRHVSQRSCLSELSRSVAVPARNYRLVSKSYFFFEKDGSILYVYVPPPVHIKFFFFFSPLPYMGGEDGQPLYGIHLKIS